MATVRERLEAVLRRPVKSASDAATVAKAAEALRMLIETEAAALRAVDEVVETATSSAPGTGPLAGLTLHTAAERVLVQAGVPLHVSELGKRIKAGGWTHPRSVVTRPNQILYQLAARLPQHPQTFKRVAPNTFALARWSDLSRAKRHPRYAIFKGPGNVAEAMGNSEDALFEGSPWRSS